MHFIHNQCHDRIDDHLHNPERGRAHRIVSHVVFGVVVAVSLALIFGGIVMWLWNAILPALLSVHAITYWQSVGVLVLSRILFGGFGRGGRRGGHRPPHGRRNAWREYETWWREVGEKSFQDYSANQGSQK